MEVTDRLQLRILDHNDYTGMWEIPLGDSFRKIEAESVELATELLGASGALSPYASQLKGTAASLKDRLNAGLDSDGLPIFNGDDLERSKFSKQPISSGTTFITDRLAQDDEREFIQARLRYMLSGEAPAMAKSNLGRRVDQTWEDNNIAPFEYERKTKYRFTGGTSISNNTQRQRQSGVLGDGIGIDSATDELQVKRLGIFNLNGDTYIHTNLLRLPIVAGTRYWLIAQASTLAVTPVDPCIFNTQLIRWSANSDPLVTPLGKGNVVVLTNPATFYATGIGRAAHATQNNDWLPEICQILRVGGRDYLIKKVDTDAVEIYGRFDENLTMVDWEIVDLTQPNFKLNSTTGTDYENILVHYVIEPWLYMGFVNYIAPSDPDNVSVLIDEPGTMANGRSYVFIPGTSYPNGVFPLGKSTLPSLLDGGSLSRIKGMKVVTFEKTTESVFNLTTFVYSIDPKKPVTVGADDYYLDTSRVVLINGGQTPMEPYDKPGQIIVYHPDYSGSGTESPFTRGLMTGSETYELLFWGVILEIG